MALLHDTHYVKIIETVQLSGVGGVYAVQNNSNVAKYRLTHVGNLRYQIIHGCLQTV